MMKQSQMLWKLILIGALTTQVGCTADGAEPMVILRNQIPGDGCIIPTNETGAFRTRGVIDVRSFIPYVFTPLVKSFAVATDNTSRIIFIEGANVDIEFTGGNIPTVADSLASSISFKTLFSGSIEAGGVSTISLDIISRELLADLVDDVTPDNPVQILASIQIFGKLDGDGVESNSFKYPVQVCESCLSNNLGLCSEITGANIGTGGVCNRAQDGVLDCCTNSAGALICPAVEEVIVLP